MTFIVLPILAAQSSDRVSEAALEERAAAATDTPSRRTFDDTAAVARPNRGEDA